MRATHGDVALQAPCLSGCSSITPRAPICGAVGTMAAPERANSECPASAHSRLSDALTAGCYSPGRMAARITLRSISTVLKTLMR